MKIQRFSDKELIPETKEILAIAFIVLSGCGVLIVLLQMFIAFRVNMEAIRKTTQVQLINGTTYYVSEKDANWRYPNVIKNFLKQWMQLAFSWDAKIPGTNAIDEGIKVGNNKVPTSCYFASLLMEPQFGKATLEQLGGLIPSGIFSGKTRTTVIVTYLSEPREIRSGEWEVDMIATRLIVDLTSGTDERIPFNKTFRVKAVEIQNPTYGTDSSPFEQKAYELRSSGLEIEKITDFIAPQ